MTGAVHVSTRADAVRNRARVLAAAAEVFSEHGVEAGVPEIAARAGVGKGTVYRAFPTKEHLIAAIASERLAAFDRRLQERLDDPDPWLALEEELADAAERKSMDRALIEAMSLRIELPELAAARAGLWETIGVLMDRARAQGRARADASPQDLRILWGGAARMLSADGIEDPAVWRRYAELVLRALSA